MCDTEAKGIEVHPLTNDPSEVWMEIFESQTFIEVDFQVSEECDINKVRIVCMSDTHSKTSKFHFDKIPDGDIFIHAGDFTFFGRADEVIQFNEWLGKLPHKYKIVIAGNHELWFDENFVSGRENESETLSSEKLEPKDHLTNCIYLQDDAVTLYGLKIYGTPWQPEYSHLAFNLTRGKACLAKWDLIPADTDILVTHTPPLGRGDLCRSGVRAGCCELLATVQKRVRPSYHVFGHIHEGYGVTSDGQTIYVNASTCNVKYVAVNPPIVFDVPLPPGFTKDGSVQ
ncbi:hypothetical protein LSTR_LSTR009238 [Laodelphax striatellus]|uniref:Calcineurin-like phosphoesterase domain-containing protein n=1 Tax=Laodelphax striatellus TaxID=195883 RepID=A0A482XE99_LAOST|nr:hypothetical protein LSTR_LSTR009238 [Laodelphax striatellus]